jgi:amidase
LEKAGAHVDEKCPKLPNLYETYVTLRGIHYATVTNSQPEAVKQKFKATLKGNLRRGLDISSQEIFNSYRSKSALYQIMRNFLNYYDVFALPVVGIQPGPVEQEFPKQVDEVPVKDYVDWLSFSFLATTTGLPSIAMPICLSNDKIPIGIQLIGPPRGERVLLQAARFLEEVVEFEKLPIDPIVNH